MCRKLVRSICESDACSEKSEGRRSNSEDDAEDHSQTQSTRGVENDTESEHDEGRGGV